MDNELAIFGGSPIKSDAYSIHTTNIGEEEEEAVLRVMRSQHLSGFSARPGERFLGGEAVQSFEKALATSFGADYVITVNSATSGLHCALYAAGVKNGDEVITVSNTAVPTVSAIVDIGAKVEGRIPKREFSFQKDQKELEIGDKIDVYLESLEDFSGSCRLSRSKAKSKEFEYQ